MDNEKVVYHLTVEDLQNVANDYFDRDLTVEEIALVTAKLGDCINWYDDIQSAIILSIGKKVSKVQFR